MNTLKKVAVIVDGQFLMHRIKDALYERKYPTAEQISAFLSNVHASDEEIYRIFFYQGEHSKQKSKKPISKTEIDFKESDTAKYSNDLLVELSKKELFAVRVGETQFRGWKFKNWVEKKFIQEDFHETLTDDHFIPEFQQKGVDIKIGLDVAWLASNKLVDRIILVTGDSDFVPAMKFARKEGLQVVLIKLGKKRIQDSLEIHSDFVRNFSDDDIKRITTIKEDEE